MSAARLSALAGLYEPGMRGAQSGLARLDLSERQGLELLLLRGKSANAGVMEAIAQVLGVSVPITPNTAAANERCTLLWLGPDEWLASGSIAPATPSELLASGCTVTDVSHGRSVIRLSGQRTRELLAKGLPIDLHPRVFGPGRCAQSAMARCNVLVHQVDSVPTFDLYVMRSYARSLWHFLTLAGEELGYRILPRA